jgi:hypothetical protein
VDAGFQRKAGIGVPHGAVALTAGGCKYLGGFSWLDGPLALVKLEFQDDTELLSSTDFDEMIVGAGPSGLTARRVLAFAFGCDD